jgi:hypothetical protein
MAAVVLNIASWCSDAALAAADSISIDDARFGSQIGSASAPASDSDVTSAPSPWPDFRGRSAQSCTALDLNAFLRQFDPHELLAELRQSLLSGAQSELTNYLTALAYSAPTLASVLDMTDRQLSARFSSFAQTCGSQHLRALALQDPGRRLARASEQCFGSEIARGTAPTDAFRRCSQARSFEVLGLPATLSTVDFLRQHSDLAITPRLEFLLAMLPDERIAAGNLQTRPPRMTLTAVAGSVQARSRVALQQLIESSAPLIVPECALDSIFDSSVPACLPHSAALAVDSPAFRGARLLGPAARSLFEDALSGQIAVTAVYSELLDLAQQIAQMSLRSTSDATSEEILARRQSLHERVRQLFREADLLVKLQESRAKAARTQLLALERAQTDLRTASDGMQTQEKPGTLSIGVVLRLFQDHN